MSKKPLSDEQRLTLLFDALADSVEEMTDDQILAEAREEGDPEMLAAKVADVVEKAIQEHNQRRRFDARHQYDSAVAATSKHRYTLPATADERRALLLSIVANHPGVRPALTLHHRELKALSDDDVEGYLRKLSDLGLLDEKDDSEA